MKNYLSFVLCLASSSLLAGVVQPLWPEGKIPDFQENQIAAPSQEVQKPGFDRAAHRMPYLEWSEKPANPNGACVILISGGAYGCTCDGPKFRPLEDLLLEFGDPFVQCLNIHDYIITEKAWNLKKIFIYFKI